MTRSTHGNYLCALLLLRGCSLPAGLLSCGACTVLLGGCTPQTAVRGRAVKPDGKTLYAADCASCHGEDGRNDRQGANPAMCLTAANALPDSQWTSIVQNGRGEMPAFRNRLSAQELHALRDYTDLLSSKITIKK